MGQEDGIGRCSGKGKSGMRARYFDKGYLLKLKKDECKQREDGHDLKIKAIDVASWKKKNVL